MFLKPTNSDTENGIIRKIHEQQKLENWKRHFYVKKKIKGQTPALPLTVYLSNQTIIQDLSNVTV